MRHWIIALLMLCWAGMAHAEPVDHASFAVLPIVHEGRAKPLDSYARALLSRLQDSDMVEGMTASAWLSEALFMPQRAVARKCIRIADPHIRATLGIEEDKELYAYREVATAFERQRPAILRLLQKDAALQSREEKAYLELYGAVNEYAQLVSTFTLLQPVPFAMSDAFTKQFGFAQRGTYLDWLKVREHVMAELQRAKARHGDRLAYYSKLEQEAVLLAFHMTALESVGQRNQILRIIPAYLEDAREWYAPWALLLEGKGSPDGSQLLKKWQRLGEAYRESKQAEWQRLASEIQAATREVRGVTDTQLALEVWYHRLQWVLWAMIAYAAAGVAFGLARMWPRAVMLACAVFGAGVLLHMALVVMRIAILERPPVSTLYESILFVSLIVALLGWWVDRKGGSEGRLLASIVGAGLLLLSTVFARSGDTLGVVMAVLNTQIWLATHVVCITIGYGCAVMAGSMAHLALWQPARTRLKRLQTMALVALLFTAIGTLLGGIWADQSWGRFWGWDPKENGALLIVLWLVWVLHGKIMGHFKPLWFAMALAWVNVVVALSWFGVNLLNVGLHSYGFTDKAAYGLALFCGIEALLIGALTWRAHKREGHAHAD